MVRGVPFGVAAVAAALYFVGLGSAPFIDPPEGFHADVARVMAESGDWVTPRPNGVRYFDKPPVLYWMMAAAFRVLGPTPLAARVWPALAAVGCAAITAHLGTILGGPRLGLLAGLMVASNLGIFLYGRIVKPDLLFVLCITLAFAAFAAAYCGGGRWPLVVFYGSLGLAAMTKDFLGALGPLAIILMFLLIVRERPLRLWFPWWGFAVLAVMAMPWYVAVELRNRGFLWYTLMDNHILNFAGHRIFPDEDVPLKSGEFVLVTAAAFMPWVVTVPWGIAHALRRPWVEAHNRLWVLFALWSVAVLGFFTVSPFKLPHYGLPAFPALALLAARVWDEAIEGTRDSVRPRALMMPILIVFLIGAAVFAGVRFGFIPLPVERLASVDVTTRNLTAKGGSMPPMAQEWRSLVGTGTAVFAVAAAGMAVAIYRRAVVAGIGVACAAMVAFLPIAGEGMTKYGRVRSVAPLAQALTMRVHPGDVVIHEGPLEDSASVLLQLRDPVKIVNGLQSNLAFGATFPEARDTFWDAARLREEWLGRGRCFLISVMPPERSVVRTLPAGRVHLITQAGGRWLYTNLAD